MPSLPDVYLERLRSIDKTYVDQRYISEQDLRLLVWFHNQLYNEMLKVGRLERRYSFRQRDQTCLLVYSVTWEDIPQVVFITSDTPIGCIRTLFRKFYAETLKWVRDKYA